LLLVRMMVNYEKRFPEDFELQAQFLELVNYVYRLENKENYAQITIYLRFALHIKAVFCFP